MVSVEAVALQVQITRQVIILLQLNKSLKLARSFALIDLRLVALSLGKNCLYLKFGPNM